MKKMVVKHKQLSYIGEIIKEFKNGRAILNIPDISINRKCWGDSARHLPFQIKADMKYFERKSKTMENTIKITAENIDQYKFFKVPETSMPWAINKDTVHHNYVYTFMTNDAVFASEDVAKSFAIANNIGKYGAALLGKELPAEEITIDCSYRLIN